jgi:hypothetical protein
MIYLPPDQIHIMYNMTSISVNPITSDFQIELFSVWPFEIQDNDSNFASFDRKRAGLLPDTTTPPVLFLVFRQINLYSLEIGVFI